MIHVLVELTLYSCLVHVNDPYTCTQSHMHGCKTHKMGMFDHAVSCSIIWEQTKFFDITDYTP